MSARREPTEPPRTAARCWPFPCRDWHETTVHLDGSDPCSCPCHEPETEPEPTDEAPR